MTRLEAHGLGVEVPRGWDGAVYRRSGDERAPTPFGPTGLGPSSLRRGTGTGPVGPPMHYPPILHLATFALPADRGDYGSGAIEGMGPLMVAEQRMPGYASQQPEFVLRRPKVIVSE